MQTIVYIDSDNGLRESVAQQLEGAGYHVLQAATAPFGLVLCEEFSPDVIVTTPHPIDAALEGPDFVAALHTAAPGTPIISIGDDADVPGARPGGDACEGTCLTRPMSFTDIAFAIQAVQSAHALAS